DASLRPMTSPYEVGSALTPLHEAHEAPRRAAAARTGFAVANFAKKLQGKGKKSPASSSASGSSTGFVQLPPLETRSKTPKLPALQEKHEAMEVTRADAVSQQPLVLGIRRGGKPGKPDPG
ncbi:unnamed protein product, partial [Effrenium voratum]